MPLSDARLAVEKDAGEVAPDAVRPTMTATDTEVGRPQEPNGEGSKLLIQSPQGVEYDVDFAAYPAPRAGDPFVFFDIIPDDGEVTVALYPDDAEKWGEALIAASQAAREGGDD